MKNIPSGATHLTALGIKNFKTWNPEIFEFAESYSKERDKRLESQGKRKRRKKDSTNVLPNADFGVPVDEAQYAAPNTDSGVEAEVGEREQLAAGVLTELGTGRQKPPGSGEKAV